MKGGGANRHRRNFSPRVHPAGGPKARLRFSGVVTDYRRRAEQLAGSVTRLDWSRTTAFRRVKEVMDAARIADGPHKCPKGLRHGYGVQAISSGVPPNMLKKWMGHASLKVTAIYSNALGEEQHKIAARMWD